MGHPLGNVDNGEECSHVKGDAQEVVAGKGNVGVVYNGWISTTTSLHEVFDYTGIDL